MVFRSSICIALIFSISFTPNVLAANRNAKFKIEAYERISETVRCPLCHNTEADYTYKDWVRCPRSGTLHHKDCLTEFGEICANCALVLPAKLKPRVLATVEHLIARLEHIKNGNFTEDERSEWLDGVKQILLAIEKDPTSEQETYVYPALCALTNTALLATPLGLIGALNFPYLIMMYFYETNSYSFDILAKTFGVCWVIGFVALALFYGIGAAANPKEMVEFFRLNSVGMPARELKKTKQLFAIYFQKAVNKKFGVVIKPTMEGARAFILTQMQTQDPKCSWLLEDVQPKKKKMIHEKKRTT